QIVRQLRAGHGHERLPLELVRHRRVARERRHPALGFTVQGAEPDGLAERAVEPGGALAGRQAESIAVGNDQELLVLDDEPVAVLGRRLLAALGGNERAAQAVDVERQIDTERCFHEPSSPTSPGWPARVATGRRSGAGASTPSFFSAGMTSRAKSRTL